MEKKRVIVYVDGYNFYYGLRYKIIRLYVRADSIEADFFWLYNKRESLLGWVVGYFVLIADGGTIVNSGHIYTFIYEGID